MGEMMKRREERRGLLGEGGDHEDGEDQDACQERNQERRASSELSMTKRGRAQRHRAREQGQKKDDRLLT